MTNDPVINVLEEVSQEDVPKNVQEKLSRIITLLQSEAPLCKCKARDAVEELSHDVALEDFTRTQLLNVMVMLE
ncbi:hypothetical protein CMO91_03985 [Candidatus Woesearchaeota archaeon]|nr:hypothetical protein [Candidatus Woesearchaeota archaeon]